jgi:hypothetical protein
VTRPDYKHHQASTGATATRYAQPWTEAQDRYLLHSEGTLAQRAKDLGRTYYAARYRLAQLRGHRGVKLVRR